MFATTMCVMPVDTKDKKGVLSKSKIERNIYNVAKWSANAQNENSLIRYLNYHLS